MARADLHNISVDEYLAERGFCAQTHLPTGRCCVRRYRHTGSCRFEYPDRAESSRRTHRKRSTGVAAPVGRPDLVSSEAAH